MPRGSDAELLSAFAADGAARIARLAASAIADAVPPAYRAAARSVARQAREGWTVMLRDGEDFHMRGAMRRFELGRSFGVQCGRVVDMLLASQEPGLRRIMTQLGGSAPACILSAFFHYFVAHELLHIEQGLGSDQYSDSDFYMPIVMEADYVADVAGLVIVLHAGVPEIAGLGSHEKLILLIAIHIASMQSFRDAGSRELDRYSFGRLILWYLHFARFAKSGQCPPLDSPTFQRPWVLTFPRLLSLSDETVSHELLARRADTTFPAGADVVLAYHGEDGMYRIHRAALTDPERVGRLCGAVINGGFDEVRSELEELLVNNPALVPSAAPSRSREVEWAAGAVIDGLERLRSAMIAADASGLPLHLRTVRDAYGMLVSVVRSIAVPSDEMAELLREGGEILDGLGLVVDTPAGGTSLPDMLRLRRRALSVVDQIAIILTDAPDADHSR